MRARAAAIVNFYGPARSDSNGAVRPRARRLERTRLRRQGRASWACRSRGSREQQDDFYSVFSQTTGINLSGVEVGATVVGELARATRAASRCRCRFTSRSSCVLGIAFGALIGRLPMLRAQPVSPLASRSLYFAGAYWQFTSYYVWLPLVVPLLVQLPVGFGAAVWWNYREVAAQRERVRTALGYYVPKSLARRLTEQTLDRRRRIAQLLHGTCLVTDAEHYTSVAEALSPARARGAHERLLPARCFASSRRYGGEISDTAGDSMIAVWASAEPDAAGARACRAGAARDSRGRRGVQPRASAGAVADEDRARVRRDVARQHRRRAALRVSSDRRHRQHGVAHPGTEPAARHARVAFGGHARRNDGVSRRATSARSCCAANGCPCACSSRWRRAAASSTTRVSRRSRPR